MQKVIEQVKEALGLVTAGQHIDELERGHIEDLLTDALERLAGHSSQMASAGPPAYCKHCGCRFGQERS